MMIATKGQVAIPLPIRYEFGLKPGTDAEFVAADGKAVLRPTRKRRDPVEDWLQKATALARGQTTTARITKLTRGEE